MALNAHRYIIYLHKIFTKYKTENALLPVWAGKKSIHYRYNVHFFDFSWGWMILNIFID